MAGAFLALASGAAPPVQAGAWLQEPGRTQVISQALYYRSQGGFDDRGRPVPGARFEKVEASLYAEHGLSRRWTLGAALRGQSSASDASAGAFSDFTPGDIDLFARRRLWRSDTMAVSVQGLAKLPYAYDKADPSAPGDGQVDLEGRVAGGRGFEILGFSGFANAEAAYRLRDGAPSDEARLDLTVGVRPMRPLLLIVDAFTVEALGEGAGSLSQTKIQAGGVWQVTGKVSVQAGAFSEVTGERSGLGEGVYLGLWYSR